MCRRKNRWCRKKRKTESRFKANKQVEVVARLCTDRESLSTKLEEDTFDIKSLSNANLSTSRRRSKRTGVADDTSYQCKICDLGFSTEHNLRQHLDYYGDPTYPCNECGTKFTDRRQLQSHISNAHDHPNPKFTEKCILCKQMFALPADLCAHLCHYHEDWKESMKTKEDPGNCLTVFETTVTEISDFIKSDEYCVEGSKKVTRSECQITPEVHLKSPKDVENNIFSTNTVENIMTSPATVSSYRLEENEIKSEVSSSEEEQTVSIDVKNIDVLRTKLKSNNENVGTTRKDNPRICVKDENCDWLEDSEYQSNHIMRENEQVLCWNGENSQVLESRLEDSSKTIISGDDQTIREGKEYTFQNHHENKSDIRLRKNENMVPVSKEYSRLQIVDVKPAEQGKSFDEIMQRLVTIRTVPNKDEVLLSDITIDGPIENDIKEPTIKESNHCLKIYDFHNTRESTKNPENIILLDARSDKDNIIATSVDFQEKPQQSNLDKSLYEVRNYEDEMKLRRLYSCKDCYVPLVRVQNYHYCRYWEKTVSSDTKPERSKFLCQSLEKKLTREERGENFSFESCLTSHGVYCQSVLKQKVQKMLIKRVNDRIVSRQYSCRVCNVLFGSEESLSEHERTYLRPANRRCVHCRTMFIGSRQLRCHMMTAHTNDNKVGYMFECPVCNQRFKQKRNARIHRMHIHRDNVFLENIPEHTTDNLSPPDSDDPEDDQESINKCDVCSIVFSKEKRFLDHIIYYRKNEIIHCKTCGEEFQGQFRAHQHNKAVHYTDGARTALMHNCNFCNEGFMYMTHLQAHISHVHINDARITNLDEQNGRSKSESQKNSSRLVDSLLFQLRDRDVTTVPCMDYTCTVCDIRFPTLSLLDVHKMDFANDGEYLCNRCSRKCRTPAILLDHLTLNHSNNAMQGGVKCRRCNENFLSHKAWVAHVKHIHSTVEPSEFYFEKNVASTETTGDTRYQLIPTNESISSGVTYFEVLNSIDIPEAFKTSDDDEGANRGGFNGYFSRINARIPEKEKLMNNNREKTEITPLNVNTGRIKVKTLEGEEMINDFDEITDNKSLVITSRTNVSIPHEKPFATLKSEQGMNTNYGFDEREINMENPEEKKATSEYPKIREATERVYEQDWNCRICGYTFRSQADLSRHMSLYSDSGRHMCESCGRRFETYEFYRGHQFSHNDSQNNDYFCSSCNEGFKLFQSMKMHVAHIHEQSLQELSSEISNKSSTSKRKEIQSSESLKLSRANAQQQRWPERKFYRLVVSSFLNKPGPHVRTYSRKQNQPVMMITRDEATNLKHGEAIESPRLHTEIFEDEMSLTYECPNCQEKYPTVERLDEHLTAVHSSNGEKTELEKSSKIPDAYACNTCDLVFANQSLLNTHKDELHFIKSMQVVRSSNGPVLEITAPTSGPKDLIVNEQPRVIGQVYKLEEINIFQDLVQHDKNRVIKMINVKNISDTNAEQQKHLSTTSVQRKPKAALQPTAKVVQLMPPVANAVQAKRCVRNVIQVKPLVINAIQAKRFVANAVEAKPLIANAVEAKRFVANSVQANTSIANAVKTKPIVGSIQMILHKLNMGQPFVVNTEEQKPQNSEVQNLPAVEQNPPKSEGIIKRVRITSKEFTNRSVLKRVIQRNCNGIAFSPLALIKPIKIVKVESCSSDASMVTSKTTSTVESMTRGATSLVATTLANPVANISTSTDYTKLHCQFRCTVCNMVFLSRSRLTAHKNNIHSSKCSNDKPVGNLFPKDNSTKSSMNQLSHFVSSLPIQAENKNDKEAEMPFSSDFESVLIPVLSDDLNLYLNENSKTDELETPVDPLNVPREEISPPDNGCKAGPLKVRSFAKIVKNLRRRNSRKRKGDGSIDMVATKHPKSLFDPVAYEELCRQHNLIPTTKPQKPKK